jgi:hypothetical protein
MPSKAGLQPIDTGARDTPAMNRKSQKKLGSKVKTKYAKKKRGPYN